MELNFRTLTAADVEVRPTNTKFKGFCELLLYIDSRSAADILNEAVGPFNWTIEYKALGDKIYGRLSIWDKDNERWVFKEDTGSESNIEADKGLSSDILKRCLARWGCDSLYSAPKIKIECPDKYYYNDKLTMTFKVSRIEIVDRKIVSLEIVDRFNNVVFSMPPAKGKKLIGDKEETPTDEDLQKLKSFCAKQKEGEVDRNVLYDFWQYYKEKITLDGFKPRSYEKLWSMWLASPNRKTNGKRQSE